MEITDAVRILKGVNMIAQITGIVPVTTNTGKSYWQVKLSTGHDTSVWDAKLMNIIVMGATLELGFKVSKSQDGTREFLNIITAVQPGQVPQATQLPITQVVDQPAGGAISPANLPNPAPGITPGAPAVTPGAPISFPPRAITPVGVTSTPPPANQMNLDQARRTSMGALANAADFVSEITELLFANKVQTGEAKAPPQPLTIDELESMVDHFHGKFLDMIMKRISTLMGDMTVSE